jgi:hypothetical protein
MKNSKKLFWVLLPITIIIGFLLAKLDTSKKWNTGITVAAIVLASFIPAFIQQRFAWLWAFIIGGFVFGFNLWLTKNTGSWGAILFAFIGAYSGVLARRIIVDKESWIDKGK